MFNAKNRQIGMLVSVLTVVLQIIMLFVGSSSDPFTKYLGIAAGILAAVCSFIYLYKGGTKNVAVWYKLFCCFFMVTLIVALIRNIQTGKGAVSILCTLFMTLIVGCISFVKDLGKKNSLMLAGLIVVLQIFTCVGAFAGGGRIPVKLLGCISSTLLAFVMINNTCAKYEDKRIRKGNDEE